MIFLVGGVPNLLFNRYQQLILKIFGDGHVVISRPVAPRRDGRFSPSHHDAIELISDLSLRVTEDPSIVANGCAALALASPGTDIDDFMIEFRPFAIFRRIDLPVPTIVVGDRGRQTMNTIARVISNSLKPVREAVRAVNSELTSRRNRTPLLLPQRNFRSPVLSQELDYLFVSLGLAPDPRAMIAGACHRIENLHPFRKPGGASFFDDRAIRYKMPGRALHGAPRLAGGDHQPTCLINGHLRLGGASLIGFHYDCTRGEKGRLVDNLPNCHSAIARLEGNPHLNIYPNDYIRGGKNG
ncbi:MAG TPA: hypothetical protein VK403_14665 [Allosphingosinicella sp.]|nr:hypothetical protein [Allosphingosinicella sp.]